jgi:hypothetical protein
MSALTPHPTVIPAQAGIQCRYAAVFALSQQHDLQVVRDNPAVRSLDSGLRRNDSETYEAHSQERNALWLSAL